MRGSIESSLALPYLAAEMKTNTKSHMQILQFKPKQKILCVRRENACLKKSLQKSAKKCLEFFVSQMQFKNELLES